MVFFKKWFLLLVIAGAPLFVSAQQKTYKVVCDKKTRKLIVVETANHSPDFVPVKGGFPFAAVARKWIQENFTTDDCDPGQLTEKIKKEEQAQPGVPARNAQPVTATPPAGGTVNNAVATQGQESSTYTPDYKYNTTFSVGIFFHNMSNVLPYDVDLPGFELSFEQFFGKKFYGGFGVHYDMYVSVVDDEPAVMYNFKFPFIGGYRIQPRRGFFGFELAFIVNTKMAALTEEYITYRGRVPANSSFSIYPRVRLGGKVVNFEMGPEIWLSEVFENEGTLFLLHMNARFCF